MPLVAQKFAFTRLMIAMLVSIVYMVFLMQASPYRRESDNAVAQIANGLLMLIFLGATVVKLHHDISMADPELAARVRQSMNRLCHRGEGSSTPSPWPCLP